jgi:hypothetical protein
LNNPYIVNEEDVKHMESVTPAPNVPPLSPLDERGGNFSATLAPGFQHDGNFVKTGYPRGAGVPSFPLLPLPAATLAQVQSNAKQIVTEAIAQIPPSTPATAVSDGLIHGALPWESDPAFVLVRDEFLTGGTTFAGDLNWNVGTNLAGTNGPVRGSLTGYPVSGAYQMSNSNQTNGSTVVFLSSVSAGGAADKWPVFDYPGWKLTFVFGFNAPQINTTPSFAQKSIYVGLASSWETANGQGFGIRPNTFMGIRYDTDPTSPAISDTTFHFEVVANVTNQTTLTSRNNTQGTAFDTGVTPQVGKMYRLDMMMVAPGVITMSLNGSTPQSFNVPTQTAGGSGSSSVFDILSTIASVEITSTTGQTQSTVFAPGSLVTVAGFTGVAAPLNGLHMLLESKAQAGTTPLMQYAVVSPDVSFRAGDANVSAVGFPAVVPIFTFGNDSQASPNTGETVFQVDFFSFIWNPGIISATAATPDKTKPRYF